MDREVKLSHQEAEVARRRRRRDVEGALRESEARLRAMLDAMPDCVKIFAADGQLTYINPKGLELLEAPDLATLSASGHVPLPPECMAECLDVHARVVGGETVVWTYEILGMQGGRRHVEAHAVPLRMPDGSPGHMSITRDITVRKQAEDTVRRSEERLRLVKEATGLADFEAGPDGVAHVSQAMIDQLGLPPGTSELPFAKLLDYIHPDDRERLKREIESSLAAHETFDCEFRIIHGVTGEVRWIHSRTKMERNEHGRPARSIGAHLDITGRKLAEEALRESEERFRLAAEAAGLGVWDYDAVLDRREWSSRLREIFGIAAEAPALLETALQRICTDDRERFLDRLEDLKAGRSERFHDAFRIAATNGSSERWIAASGWRAYKTDSRSRRILLAVRDVTDEKTAEDRIRWSASHDPLTALANRALFQERLEAAIAAAEAQGGAVGVLMLDVDHFKQVNDSLGHDVGDALLRMFAERLCAAAGEGDTVARLGGDEFAIVVPGLVSSDALVALSDAIQKSMRAPFIHRGRMLDCRVSAGAALFPAHGRSPAELLKNADAALYAAKAGGRARMMLFERRMREDLQRRTHMVRSGREAVAEDRILPYYQPKADLKAGGVAGFEALLRWQMPGGGIGHPAALEAAFEDLEVAAAISDRMIDRVIVDMRDWLEGGVAFHHVAINASAAEFRSEDFAERLLERLAQARIPAECLQLEVTETVFLGRGAEYVHQALAQLSGNGVKIALDDFGTGYASLRHLREFPVDIIKIDRSFVCDMLSDPDDEAIVRAVLTLGQSLGIAVVAEGIESQAQARRLIELGCDYGQGFLLSKAVPAELVPWLVGHLSTALLAPVPDRAPRPVKARRRA